MIVSLYISVCFAVLLQTTWSNLFMRMRTLISRLYILSSQYHVACHIPNRLIPDLIMLKIHLILPGTKSHRLSVIVFTVFTPRFDNGACICCTIDELLAQGCSWRTRPTFSHLQPLPPFVCTIHRFTAVGYMYERWSLFHQPQRLRPRPDHVLRIESGSHQPRLDTPCSLTSATAK